nr:AMP-binding protein [Motiliproteus sp. SC1-56]
MFDGAIEERGDIDYDHYQSLVELIDTACDRFPDAPAVSNLGRTLSYRELQQATRDFAAYLQHHTTLEPGDRIAIQLPNLIQYPVALFGALRAGLVVVNTNPLYSSAEMLTQFQDSGARALVVLANLAHQVEEIIDDTALETVIITQVGDAHPPARRLFINSLLRHVKRMVPEYNLPGAISYTQVMKEGGQCGAFEPPELTQDDLALLQYTGGTTGIPKGAMLSHRNILANMLQVKALLERLTSPGREVVIAPLPLYHIYSFTLNCVLMPEIGGHVVLITNPRDIPAFVRELRRWRFTILSGLNTLFVALCKNPRFRELDFSSLKLTLSGGMPLTVSVAREWESVTGCPVVEGYGLTETSPIVSVNPPESIQLGTIGLPIADTEVRLVDADGTLVPRGGMGELQVRGPQVMQGYWNRPQETRQALDPDGWFRTGDVAQVEEDGYLRIVDRKKDMIIVSGFNVYPNELEKVIAGHPDIDECAVVGLPDETQGERIKVYVSSRNPELTVKDVRDYCRERLTPYKVPQVVEFRSELPKSAVGKVLRRVLRDEEAHKRPASGNGQGASGS